MIDSKSFDDLVPVFLMDSGVFHVVILDVEGSILKGNVCFAELNPSIESTVFCDFLTPGSKVVFSKLLDALLEVPSSAKDHMLTHSREHGGTFEVSWGFSLVSDSNVSGIVGIGVAAELLEKEMDWCNPLDLLEFGEIKLDRESKVVGWDRRILKWFDVEEEKWKSRPLADLPAFEACVGLNETLQQVGKSGKPKIFHLAPKVAQKRVFIAVLSADPGGYSLILKPKDIPIQSQAQTNGSLVSDEVLAALPGAILVLDETGNLCQQNEAARNLGRVWNGRAYSEGFPLTFSIHSSRFAELLQAMEACKKGIANDLELTLPKSDHAFDDLMVKNSW